MGKEILFVVVGRPRRKTGDAEPTRKKLGVFDSMEVALDYGKSLASFDVYRADLNGFVGAELIVHGSVPHEIQWLGHSPRPDNFESLIPSSSEPRPTDNQEPDLRDEEHLDWEV